MSFYRGTPPKKNIRIIIVLLVVVLLASRKEPPKRATHIDESMFNFKWLSLGDKPGPAWSTPSHFRTLFEQRLLQAAKPEFQELQNTGPLNITCFAKPEKGASSPGLERALGGYKCVQAKPCLEVPLQSAVASDFVFFRRKKTAQHAAAGVIHGSPDAEKNENPPK